MTYLPCRNRTFPYRLNLASFYKPYLRWLRHLSERLGLQNTLSLWQGTFVDYDAALLMQIFSSGWSDAVPGADQPADDPQTWAAEFFPVDPLDLSVVEARKIVEHTPPVSQILRLFPRQAVEKDLSAYHALHLRFDGLACLSEAILEKYGKQGELIVYDLMVEGRLALGKGETGSVEEFIQDFTAQEDTPNLFTAGLETELLSKTKREAVLSVRECEWARYFRERHPTVGYLMACSTDEAAYRAFNPSLRLERTRTLMEGGADCDFRVFAVS